MSLSEETLWNIIWKKVDKSGDCWIWNGKRSKYGYGIVLRDSVCKAVHRHIYERMFGKIPDGRDVHHTCRVRYCVNPDHLVIVSRKEHACLEQFGANSKKTHCRNGHPFNEDNTYRWNGGRYCRVCNLVATWKKRGKLDKLQESMVTT